MNIEIESLEPILERVERFLAQQKIPVISGAMSDSGNFPQVDWCLRDLSGVDLFLEQFVQLGSRFMLLDQSTIERVDIEEAVSALEEGDDEFGVSGQERIDELKRALESAGVIGSIQLVFFSATPPYIQFTLSLRTKLYSLIFERETDDETEGYDEDYEPLLSDEEIEEAANRLANDKNFQLAANKGNRVVVAQRIFKSDLREHIDFPLLDIVHRASGIFQVDILPQQELELADQARQLEEQGLTRADIAKKLSITTARLRKLI